MSKNKLYITLILLLTLAFSTRAIANLTLGTTSVTSNGALTLTTSSSTLVLPTTNGTNGQVLTTNGSGVTSWTTVSGGGLACLGCTASYLPVFNGTNFTDSRYFDDGTNILVDVAPTNGTIEFDTTGSGVITLAQGQTRVDISNSIYINSGPNQTVIGDSNESNNSTVLTVSDSDQKISLKAANGVFINGVKKYAALITQSGTSAPVATVLENTLGGTVVWTRLVEGLYAGTLNGAFPQNKTTEDTGFVSVSDGWTFQVNRSDNNTIILQTFANGANAEDFADDFFIEIRVYP